MIRPKAPKPTPQQEKDAYALATARDHGTCVIRDVDCAGAAQRDHRQNRQAGNTVASNLQLLCVVHHNWKGDNPTKAVAEGLAVSRHQDYRTWPARRTLATLYGQTYLGWVLYFDAPDEHGLLWSEVSDESAQLIMRGE